LEDARWENLLRALEKACALTDMTGQIGLIGEMSKKSVEFILNTGFETGHHADQQHGKGQFACSDKGVVVKAGLFEQVGGMEMSDKTN